MKQFLYEILVRGHPDGSLAAHQKMGVVSDDGLIRELMPTQLDPSLVASVLGDAFPNLVTQLAAANASIEAKDAEIVALQKRVAWLENVGAAAASAVTGN